ncbi:MAG TPA: hypothetical protein VG713_16710 [Pirellulales bacterium]|nr:hypothetical protein [Pirellulales bacterium]
MFLRALPLVCVLIVVMVTDATAQSRRGGWSRRGGPGGSSRSSPTMLLGQESVQKELQLNPKQIEALTKISEQQRAAMSQLFQQDLDRDERSEQMQAIGKQAEAMVANILSPQQVQRLTQISLQQQGARAFERPEVVQGLGLTPEQLAQIEQVQEAANEEISELFRKQMEEIRKAAEQRVVQVVLNPDQAAQWNQARGETFTGEIVYQRYGSSSRSPGETASESNASSSATQNPSDSKYKAAPGGTSAQRSTAPNAKKPATVAPKAPPAKKPVAPPKKSAS